MESNDAACPLRMVQVRLRVRNMRPTVVTVLPYSEAAITWALATGIRLRCSSSTST